MKTKKIILLALVTLCLSTLYGTTSAVPENDEPRFNVIVTECGTDHQIPPCATVEETLKYMDDYTKKDCKEDKPWEKK